MPLIFKVSKDDKEILLDSLTDPDIEQEDSLDLTDLANLDPEDLDALSELLANGMTTEGIDLQALMEKLRQNRDKGASD